MFHHPTCPHYRPAWPCTCSCRFTQPISSLSQPAIIYPAHSEPRVQPSYQAPPPYSPLDPVQSTRLIRQGFERAAQRLDDLSTLCERRVHFDLPHRATKRSSSMYADGICESHPHERDRLQHQSTITPDVRVQVHPRSLHRHQLQPTIYIVTFSTDAVPNHSRNVMALLDSQIPTRNPPIPHLYTIDARSMIPPSAHQCTKYSGISPIIQDVVMTDRAARKAVKTAVRELLDFGVRERRKGGEGRREVSMSVCCTAGTHRSVAIGERIAQGVKSEVGRMGTEEGVTIVVRHVHRIKGWGDPV